MSRRTPVEAQTWQIANNRAHASRAIARRRTRARTLPRVVVGLSVLTGLGVATAWVEQQLPAAAATPAAATTDQAAAAARDAASKATAAQLAAYRSTLAALAKTLQADNKAIAGLGTASRARGGSSGGRGYSGSGGGSGGSVGGGGSVSIPGIPSLPTINIPAPPPVQGTTGASAGR